MRAVLDVRLISAKFCFCFLLALFCVGGVASRNLCTADEPSPPVTWREAYEHLQKGRYEEAQEAYEFLKKQSATQDDLPGEFANSPHPLTGPQYAEIALARIDLETGHRARACERLEALKKLHSEQPRILGLLAWYAFLNGKLDVAETIAQEAIRREADELWARRTLAEVYQATGRLKQADEGWRYFVRYYNRVQPEKAEELLLAAEGSLAYARWHTGKQIFDFVLNTLCVDALKADPLFWQAHELSGRLLLEKYNKPQAQQEFQAALAINPRAVTVLLGRAQAAAQDYDWDASNRLAREVLKNAPGEPLAHTLLARSLLFSNQPEAALEQLKQAKAICPTDPITTGLIVAAQIQRDGIRSLPRLQLLLESIDHIADLPAAADAPEAYETTLIAAAKINSACGEVLATTGEALEMHRKFELAEKFYRAALAVMPQLTAARNNLGMLTLQMARVDEARTMLDQAFKSDPYHMRVSNMRKVIRQLDGYATLSTDHFVIRYDNEQDELLARYMSKFLENEVYPQLVKQFGYEPSTRTTIEIYSKGNGQTAHEWFSARMVGLPWVQTIGASTGMMIALASPNGLNEPYNWSRVIRHEYVHVLTLQQTQFNIPHWYTEALAVRNEGYPRPAEWNDMLRKRVPRRDLRNLSNLNLGFISAKNGDDWNFAYCQSDLYANYLVERFGEPALEKLLLAYRAGKTTEVALKELFQTDIKDFEAGYLDYLDRIVAQLPGRAEASTEYSKSEVEAALEKEPRNAEWLGRAAMLKVKDRRRDEARKLAREALEIDPHCATAAIALAELDLRGEAPEKAIQKLTSALDSTQPDHQLLQRLLPLLIQTKRWDEALKYASLAETTFPSDISSTVALAEILPHFMDLPRYKAVLEKLSMYENDESEYRLQRAEIAWKESDLPNMARYAAMVLEIDVTEPKAHWLLAEGLSGVKPEEALEEFSIACELDDELAEAWAGWAVLLQTRGQLKEARQKAETALALDAKNARALEVLNKSQPAK